MSSALFALALAGSAVGPRAAPPTPVVVELFTSEGCSDCPPADAVLQELVETQPVGGAEIVALGQHVDYRDRLGWKDRFSSAALTSRQQLYATRFNSQSIYTPQMVVDGRAELVGSAAAAARRAIERSLTMAHGVVNVAIESDVTRPAPHVAITVAVSDLPKLGRGDRADIVVAVIEDHLRSDVKRGENHGRVLTHAAVVRYMATIGQAGDGASSARAEVPLAQDWQHDELKAIAFVQESGGRTILASAVAPLKNVRR